MKIIKIYIERHNNDNMYYTHYEPCYYYTKRDISNKDIEKILKTICPKYSPNESCNNSNVYDIDSYNLKLQLAEYDIYKLTCDVSFNFDLDNQHR